MTAGFVPTWFSRHCLEFVWERQKSRDWKSMWIQLKHCRPKYIWTVTGRNLATDQIHHMTIWRTCHPIHTTMSKVSVLEPRLFSKKTCIFLQPDYEKLWDNRRNPRQLLVMCLPCIYRKPSLMANTLSCPFPILKCLLIRVWRFTHFHFGKMGHCYQLTP